MRMKKIIFTIENKIIVSTDPPHGLIGGGKKTSWPVENIVWNGKNTLGFLPSKRSKKEK